MTATTTTPARRWTLLGLLSLATLMLAMPLPAARAGQTGTPVPGTPVAVVRDVLGSSDPAAAPEEVLQLARYTIAAGARLPVHTHPGDQMATVDAGTLTYHVVANGEAAVTRADGTTEVLRPGERATFEVGDAWVEPEGMVHYAENLSGAPVVLIAASLFAAGEPLSEIVKLATPAA